MTIVPDTEIDPLLPISRILPDKPPIAPASLSIVKRLSSLLVYQAQQNATKGREPRLIGGELNCGLVVRLLGVSIAELATALCHLQALGHVRSTDDGDLELTNIGGLLRLAFDEPPVPGLHKAA